MFRMFLGLAIIASSSIAYGQCSSGTCYRSYGGGGYRIYRNGRVIYSGVYNGGVYSNGCDSYGVPVDQSYRVPKQQTQPQQIQPQLETPQARVEFDEPLRSIEWIRIKVSNGKVLTAPVLNGYMPQPDGTGGFNYDLKIAFDENYKRQFKSSGYVTYVANVDQYWKEKSRLAKN